MRRAARVDSSQADIVKALRTIHCTVHIIREPVDLLVRVGSVYVTAECKTRGPNAKRRQPAQIDHADDALRHKAPHFILQSIDDALAMYQAVMHEQGRGMRS